MYDAIIVGSGPAGVSAARKLRNRKVLMLDTGLAPPPVRLGSSNIHQSLDNGEDLFNELIGEKYQGIENIQGAYLSPKLKGPLMRYVWSSPGSEKVSISSNNFDATISYAEGGLANAWGAGVMRYTDRELSGFPISSSDLDPYYDDLTRHIGIAGENDDLGSFFGSSDFLLPPRPLSPISQNIISKYNKKRASFHDRNIFCGRLRSAVLSQPHNNRAAYRASMQDFFQTRDPAIYTPAFTLKELVDANDITYSKDLLVTHYEENDSGVTVHAKNLKSSSVETFTTQKLFLGAGAINTARIVLASNRDFSTTLPLLDNPIVFIPFIDPFLIGSPFPTDAYPGAELVMIHDYSPSEAPIQGSMYGLYGPLRTDLVAELPFHLGTNIVATRFLGPALGMLQVFFPDTPHPENFLRLHRDETLELTYKHTLKKNQSHIERISAFVRSLQSMHLITAKSLCRFPAPGSSIHYAGSLPMKKKPETPYQTHPTGQLNGTKNIYIIDAANFPCLPSKNHTFTIMANAMRIAESS